MSFNSNGHKFSTVITYGDGTDYRPTKYIDTFQAVKKPIADIRFGKILPDDAVTLAYAAVEELDADNNLIVDDFSDSLAENSRDLLQNNEDTFSAIVYTTAYRNVLPTDKFTTAIPSKPQEALYYVHKLPAVNTDRITILDSNFNDVGSYTYEVETVYVYDETTGVATTTVDYVAVYNNYENSFDEETGELTVYYIRYIDEDGVSQTVLLNNKPIWTEATADDIWYTGKLKPWVKAYLVEEISTYYKLTFPTSTTYSILILENARIYVERPAMDDKDYPWFLRIADGSFLYTSSDGIKYIYDIPEFSSQTFNPIEPYKISAGEPFDIVAKNIIKIARTPALFESYTFDIIIKNKNEEVIYALTTDSTKDSTAYNSTVSWSTDEILSYSEKEGFIQLDLVLKDYYTGTVTYRFEEKYYEYVSLDLNPMGNTSIPENGFAAIYLVPRSTALGTENATTTVNYLLVNCSGSITYTSQAALNVSVDSGGIIGMQYGDRRQTEAGSGTGTFLNEYTVIAPSGEAGQTYRYFVIAEASVTENVAPNDVVLLDVRKKGGGIKDENVDDVLKISPESIWYLRGNIPYGGQGSVIVKLPYTLLSDYGGTLTKKQVEDLVKKHMAFGTYPVIRYYGPQPDTTFTETSFNTPGAVRIEWPSEIPNIAELDDNIWIPNATYFPSPLYTRNTYPDLTGAYTMNTFFEYDSGGSTWDSYNIYSYGTSISASRVYVLSGYFKAINRNYFMYWVKQGSNGFRCGYDLSTGNSFTSYIASDFTIQPFTWDLGNGYYKCGVSFTGDNAGDIDVYIGLLGSADVTDEDFVSYDQDSFAWGHVRLEEKSTTSVFQEIPMPVPIYAYNIYYGKSENGRFTKHNTTPVPDAIGNTNVYYIDNLTPNNVYWVYVAAVNEYGNEYPPKKKHKIFVPEIYTGGERNGHMFVVGTEEPVFVAVAASLVSSYLTISRPTSEPTPFPGLGSEPLSPW